MSLRAFAVVSMSVFGLLSCGPEREAGNSVETENSLARMLPVDSILPDWNRPSGRPTVVCLRFDARNFDFTGVSANGRGIDVERMDGTPIPFEISVWDSVAKRGKMRLRIESSLQGGGDTIRLRWRLGAAARIPDPIATWAGISDSQKLALTSVLVDDFEDGDDTTLLPSRSRWRSGAMGAATVSGPFYDAAGDGRDGLALRAGFWAVPQDYVVIATSLGTAPRSLRGLDSIVFQVRGSGRLYVAFEHLTGMVGPKSWTNLELTSGWTRVSIAPGGLDPAGAPGNAFNNYGWNAVRDSVTDLSFILQDGDEVHLDDIRLYGVDRDDLR